MEVNSKRKRSQRLRFTLWQGSLDDSAWKTLCAFNAYQLDDSCQYMRVQQELGEKDEGLHLQGWVYMASEVHTTPSNFKRIAERLGLKGAHFGVCNGNIEQNEKYCSKGPEEPGGRVEGTESMTFGECPRQGDRVDLRNEAAYLLARFKDKNDELDPWNCVVIEPDAYDRKRRWIQDYKQYLYKQIVRVKEPRCIWYWGEAGMGKSHQCFTGHGDYRVMIPADEMMVANPQTKWWDRLNPFKCKVLVFNDLRGEIDFNWLLQIADHWPAYGPVRNMPDVPLMFDTLVISCLKHPEDVYKRSCEDGDKFEQFKRRFEIIEVKRILTQKKQRVK